MWSISNHRRQLERVARFLLVALLCLSGWVLSLVIYLWSRVDHATTASYMRGTINRCSVERVVGLSLAQRWWSEREIRSASCVTLVEGDGNVVELEIPCGAVEVSRNKTTGQIDLRSATWTEGDCTDYSLEDSRCSEEF